MYFEAVSSLKINFFKSKLIGIKVLGDQMVAFAEMIGCKVSKLLLLIWAFLFVLALPLNLLGRQ